MTREQVWIVVDRERDYQNQKYPSKDADVSYGILLLQEYLDGARYNKVHSDFQFHSLQEIAKVAAIAVSILENADGSEELLTKGLR